MKKKKWRYVLNIFFDTIRTLSGLGVAFRGHREKMDEENPGIYLSIIKLISRHNSTLHDHIESSNRIKYLSKTITFELLNILADQTRDFIINECKEAKFFTLIADSTTDVAHLGQMAILVRYVTIQKNETGAKILCIKERFLCFIRIKKGDAVSISHDIIGVLFEKYLFEKIHLCGQAFDGAPVMSGELNGLQALIKRYVGEKAFVPYIHCTAHQLNLVLSHAAEKFASPSIKLFFATLQRIFNYFSQSHRRWENLLEESKNLSQNTKSFGIQLLEELKLELFETNSDCRRETQDEQCAVPLEDIESEALSQKRRLHIKGLSDTRWSARLKAVEAIIQNLDCVVNCLERETSREKATGEDIMDANSLLSAINWLFLLNLTWWHSVLSFIDIAEVQLQKKEVDLLMAQNCLENVMKNLQNLREESKYDSFVSKAKSQWEKMGWKNPDFPIIRQRRTRKMPGEKAEDSSLDMATKHRIGYFEVLDRMCSELQERAKGFDEINSLFGFLKPESFKNMEEKEFEKNVCNLMEKYPTFFTTALKYELISFADIYFSQEQDSTKHSPLQYLNFIVEKNLISSFPECCSLLRLFLTLPVSTASAERTMSSLKKVKDRQRSTMSAKALDDFSILFIEQQVANQIDLDATIEVFAEKKARRGFKNM